MNHESFNCFLPTDPGEKKTIQEIFLGGILFLGKWEITVLYNLGGGFKYVLFSPLPGEDSHFD